MSARETDGWIKYSQIYGSGAVMGFTPRQIDQMSIGEWAAIIDGYNRVHSPDDKPEAMSGSEYDDLIARNLLWVKNQNNIVK